jgi:hypothetical protein
MPPTLAAAFYPEQQLLYCCPSGTDAALPARVAPVKYLQPMLDFLQERVVMIFRHAVYELQYFLLDAVRRQIRSVRPMKGVSSNVGFNTSG